MKRIVSSCETRGAGWLTPSGMLRRLAVRAGCPRLYSNPRRLRIAAGNASGSGGGAADLLDRTRRSGHRAADRGDEFAVMRRLQHHGLTECDQVGDILLRQGPAGFHVVEPGAQG